jgi:hypothetical protein
MDEPWPMRFAGGTPPCVWPAKEKEVRISSLTSGTGIQPLLYIYDIRIKFRVLTLFYPLSYPFAGPGTHIIRGLVPSQILIEMSTPAFSMVTTEVTSSLATKATGAIEMLAKICTFENLRFSRNIKFKAIPIIVEVRLGNLISRCTA